MYLKSIEVQGFKSFANKILFEFHNGITGIVGPNGSGKSNVADAVRWVLGEQRIKQLRGGSMQDVIFAGTEVRKPQGFAYVAITLDNSDHKLPISFDQVTVSRRLYRSGESEYRINGSACRLKDIAELFYDTGIGKEGYSIIGQGQIDKILSGRPEERRELFDEAAGIVKFKRRKLIAQKKLEDEKQNLVRVSDILAELEKQVGPLEKQSEAAREYLRLKEELRRFDANLFLAEVLAMKEQTKGLEEREAIVSGDLEGVKEESGRLKAEYDELSSKMEALEAVISSEREQIGQSQLMKESLEGRIQVLNEQINTERMNAEHLKNRMDAIKEALDAKEAQKGVHEEERRELASQVKEIMARLSEAEEELAGKDGRIAELSQAMEVCKTEMIDALNEKAALAGRQQRYETMLEQVNVRRSEVFQKLIKIKSDESVQEEQLLTEKNRLDGIRETLLELTSREKAHEADISGTEEILRELRKRFNQCQQEYHTSNTKLESLKNLAERYDGYGNSIRRVMEVRDRVRGIHGVVADLVTTTKQYETAIETALGGSIQNVVTDSEQTAKQLIEYLKKNRYGRATFLPLTGIGNKTTFNQESALSEPGVLGLAHTLVQTKPQYEGMVKYLLGRVVVVDQIDHAIALARKYKHSLRIVTLEGELLNPGGSMTGGAFKNSSNLLGRRREIEELEEGLSRALKAVDELQKEQAVNEAGLEEHKKSLAAVKAEKQSVFLEQNTVQMNISQLEARKQEIADSSAGYASENQELEVQVKELKENRTRLEAEKDTLFKESENKNAQIERWTTELSELKAVREECAARLSGVQMEAAGMRHRDSFVEENIRRIQLEIEHLVEEREGLHAGSSDSGQVIEARLSQIEEVRQAIEEALSQTAELEAVVGERQREKEDYSARQKTFFARREDLSEQINRLDKDLFRIQNQKEKIAERMDGQVNYMWNEYELTYSLAEKLKDEELDVPAEMKRRIESLKAGIRGLGNINVNAIEDYKEVAERYEFMKTQHDDLVAAEGALLKIIDELDTGMRRQFEEKFQEIREEFDKVFRELFGGGHGTLTLQEEEDILEAGIQIISQPPGKKLQNMMQLSGGEKALTAIALLFSIQNLKPSPFCLLDEIEAALDDSNVDRFAGYLHKLTKNTQFIVITHRRGTMVLSDRLYGITMQEKGVSTLVSVSLIESELDQ